MADKRISQLVDRGTVANNDVVPIVVSGATTTNKATISSIQTFMQGNLDLGVTSVGITLGSSGTDVSVSGSPITSSGNITINLPTASATNRGLLSSANWTTFNNKVSSVGLSMPSAFSVANSPITGSGTIAVTGAGSVSQYVRGDGTLADFPSISGGGSSVSYYLNLSVSQGSIGGIAYSQLSKVPIFGAGTDTAIASNGYIASFITDAGDPALLQIPAGNWNFETYFQASSGGGSPSFYIELYKVNSGGTATLIASNSATPELISFGTSITPYFSALAVPTTTLALTDRLALRYYVNNSGRTITLHTENSHLCQIITTFTTGLTALNGLTAQVQNFATGTSGTDFAISSASAIHTFNLPNASATARGVVTTGTQTFAGLKIFTGTISANNDIQLAAAGTASTTFIKNISGAGLTSIGSNGFGFNNSDNIYFSGSNKGGGIIAFSNTGNRTYTLQDASGTLAFTSDISTALAGYVTLATTQTITAQKTFTTSGGSDSVIITTTGAGFALDAIKAGNGEVIRVNKTSGSGNAMTVIGGNFEAPTIVKTGGTSSQFLKANGSVDSSTYLTTGTAASTYLPLTGGTLTGALNGTSATFSGIITANSVANSANGSINIENTDPTLRFRVTGGTANSRIYEWRAVAAGGVNDIMQLRLWNDAQSSPSTLFTIASTGAATFKVTSESVFDLLTLYNTSTASAGARLRFQNGYGDLAGIKVSQRDNGSLSDDGFMEFQVGSNASLATKFSIRNDGLLSFPQINDFTTGNSPNTWINPASSYGIYINTSSIRYKRDVVNYNKGIDIVNQLRPVYYKGKSDIDGDKQFAGFIAEEIHDLGLTEFVQYNEEGLPNSLAYPNMITLAIKAIQELKTEIDSLKNQIK